MNSSMNHTHPADETRCSAPSIAADLKAYADNELTVLRRRTVATHLRRCAACRTEITAMTNIASDIKNAAAGSATVLPPDLRQRLLERMGTETPSPSVPTARTLPLWRRKPLLVFGGGAATAAAFAVVFVPSFNSIRQQAVSSNSNQIGLALSQYTQNYDETFPAIKGAVETPQATTESYTEDSAGTLPRNLPTAASGVLLDSPAQGYSGTSTDAGIRLKTPVVEGKLSGEVADIERQVHRDGSVTVAVDKLEAASDKVEQTVKASGGYVASNDLTTDSSGYKSANLTVRVPVDQFDDMLKQFVALGTVTAKSVSGEDITERMSDATQAEQVLRESAETAARKLRNNGGSEKEIRYREADLRRVRIELAQTQARLGLLRKMAKLSTINVSLTEKAKRAAQTPPPSGFLGDLSETNRMASAAFASAIRVPVVLIIWVLAFSPLWVPLLLIYRYASRRNGAEAGAGPKASSIEA